MEVTRRFADSGVWSGPELDWLQHAIDDQQKRYWGPPYPSGNAACNNYEVIGDERELQARA